MKPINIFKVVFTSIFSAFLITIAIGLPIYIFDKIFPKYDFFESIPFQLIFLFFLILGLVKNFIRIKDEEMEEEIREQRRRRDEFFEKH